MAQKAASQDILAILRLFGLAGDENVPRHIERINYSHPTEFSLLVQFIFQGKRMYVVFDDTAEDDSYYIEELVKTARQSEIGELIKNPRENNMMTYGMPFKGKDVYLFVAVSPTKRLDVELARRYPDISRSTWQKHIKAGHIEIKGKVITSPKTEVAPEQAISINIPEFKDHSEESLPIIYLDDDVIIVDKPAGILTHSKGELNDEFTVADFFKRYTSWGLNTNRAGIVHRLDRDTSGVIIGARHEEAAKTLQKQFSERKAKKTYMAVVVGTPKNPRANIDLPIARNPSAPSTFRVDAKGKEAQTSYQVVASNEKYSLIELKPRTGRTHQLRVHMQYIGTPILGDRVYGKESDRLYLHARSLEVTMPNGERKTFESKTPEIFQQRVKR